MDSQAWRIAPGEHVVPKSRPVKGDVGPPAPPATPPPPALVAKFQSARGLVEAEKSRPVKGVWGPPAPPATPPTPALLAKALSARGLVEAEEAVVPPMSSRQKRGPVVLQDDDKASYNPKLLNIKI